jgi:hypothetical protein
MACAGDAPPAAPASETALVIEEIEETTVGDLGGHRVPMGNMTRGTYTLPDGSERTGPICSLVLPGRSPGVFVGQGSVVTVGEHRWEVVTVDQPAEGLGNVTLKRLD